MTFTRAIAAVLASTLFVATIGVGIGYALGHFVPGYYRSIFRGGDDPRFDPLSIGVGQGLTQGAAGGVLVGLIVVALLSWRDVRLKQVPQATSTFTPITNNGSSARVLLIVGGLLGLIFCTGAGLLLGAIGGERGAYHRRYLEEQEVLAPVVASDPSFATIKIDERSRGGADLNGVVQSAAEMDRLQAALVRAVGESRAKELLAGVKVKK